MFKMRVFEMIKDWPTERMACMAGSKRFCIKFGKGNLFSDRIKQSSQRLNIGHGSWVIY